MKKSLLPIAVSFVVFSCANKKGEGEDRERLPARYYYFPRANLYFDSANKDYIFLGNKDSTWIFARQVPSVVEGLMDKGVFISKPAQPVWKDNETHRIVYSSVLYATENDTATVRLAPKPEVKKNPSVANEDKEKKGLGKIVDKIFGFFKKVKVEEDSL